MKLIPQSHEIMHMDNILRVERAGRTCYKSEDKIGCTLPNHAECTWVSPMGDMVGPVWDEVHDHCGEFECENHSANQFAEMLLRRGHEAMIEHGSATVKFITNRGVTHELVRHRVASFGQESTRYVNYAGDDIQFILPTWMPELYQGDWGIDRCLDYFGNLPDGDTTSVFIGACNEAEYRYKQLIQKGWRPEQAREVLPNALKTEIVITANFREWRHIFKLRAIGTTGRPHPQMKALMMPVLHEFAEACPSLFGDLLELEGN